MNKLCAASFYLNIHFQFQDFLPELKQQFDLADRYKELAKKRIDEIASLKRVNEYENLLFVGVHFRGKDYASILKIENFKQLKTRKFYQKAFQFYREKFSENHRIIFLVVTDDPRLAKAVLKGKI